MPALAATCVVAALAAPTAGAAGKHGTKSSASSAFQVKANASVTKKRLAQRIRIVDRRSKSNRRSVRRLGRRLNTLGAQLRAAITGGDKTLDDRITGIVGVVTPIVTQLGDAAKALDAGLRELAAATEGGFLEVETALTEMGDFLGAQEYGAAKGRIELPAAAGGTVGLTPAVVSPDIPDTGNPATATGEIPVDLSGLSAGDGTADISVLAAIRSAEADGAATGDPAGQVGVIALLKCGTPEAAACSDGTDSYEPGQLMCTLTTMDQNLTTLQQKVDILDTDAPEDGAAGSHDATEGDSCQARGDAVYTLTITSQFTDIPTSPDPGPKD